MIGKALACGLEFQSIKPTTAILLIRYFVLLYRAAATATVAVAVAPTIATGVVSSARGALSAAEALAREDLPGKQRTLTHALPRALLEAVGMTVVATA